MKKKPLLMIIIVSLIVVLAGCGLFSDQDTTTSQTTNPGGITEIEFYSLNDFHGGAYGDEGFHTISGIVDFIKYKQDVTEHMTVMAAGDIFQGTVMSNYYHGRPLVEIMNMMGMDGFTLGNHEFDWGLEEIGRYSDGNLENGEADFPFLAANIIEKDTGEMLPWTEPYVIREFDGVRVGVIGVIGDVINSIAASRTEDVIFEDPEDTVHDYARTLREEEDCDIIVVYAHGYEYSFNNDEVAGFTDGHRVDAIFNGHTHDGVAGAIPRSNPDALPLFYAQADNYDSYLVKIILRYDKGKDELVGGFSDQVYAEAITGTDEQTDQIIATYENDADYVEFSTEVLAVSDGYYDRYDLAPWAASVIRDYMSVDVGAVNSGGFRVSMVEGEITMGDFLAIYPFDNVIKTTELSGNQLKTLYADSQHEDIILDNGIEEIGGVLYVGGTEVEDGETYTVGAVDYIFDKTDYIFLDGENIQTTDVFIRDLLADDLRNETGTFNPNDGTNYTGNENLSEHIFPEYEDMFTPVFIRR